MSTDEGENMLSSQEDDIPDELFESNFEREMPKLEMCSAQSKDHDSKKRRCQSLKCKFLEQYFFSKISLKVS